MRVAIIGSRTFEEYSILVNCLNKFQETSKITSIVSGGARGADSLAEKYAFNYNIPFTSHLAEWEIYGKSAGFIRNEKIIKDCDCVIAFWDGLSKGTLHSLNLANKLNIKSHIIYYNKSKTDLF